MTEATPVRLGIPPPPDHIFKFRRNRQAPAQEVWGRGSMSYIPEYADYRPNEGNFVYYYGALRKGDEWMVVSESKITKESIAEYEKGGWTYMPPPPFPSRTVAPVEAIYAMNGLKRQIITALQIVMSLPKDVLAHAFLGKHRRKALLNQVCKGIISIANVTIYPYYLNDEYYCKFTKEVRKFVQTLLISLEVEEAIAIKIGEIIGMFFEYDNAYRWRGQDIMTEASQRDMLTNLPKEIARLVAIEASRETVEGGGQQVVGRFQSVAKMLSYMWMIPSVKKALKEAIQSMNFENCKLENMDIYHSCLYGDYDTRGMNLAARLKVLEAYHGTDMNKWPPRMEIKQSIG